MKLASYIVHEAWIENYTYWVNHKPWKGGVYKKPKNALGDERHAEDKDRVIARYIIDNHLDYQQFVRSFTPRQLEELEDKSTVFPPSSDPLSIQPTIVIDESGRDILKRTIDSYKTETNNAPIYDFTTHQDAKLYLGSTSQVALTSKFRGKLAGSRGVVISVDEVNGEELPLVRFLDGDETHVGYTDGAIPLMTASYVALDSDTEFELEMCTVDGNLINVDMIGHAIRKARTFDCVEVKNLPSWTPETVLDLISDPRMETSPEGGLCDRTQGRVPRDVQCMGVVSIRHHHRVPAKARDLRGPQRGHL